MTENKVVLSERFKFGETLGQGAFAKVVRVTDASSGAPFAMKIIEKAHCRGQEGHIVSEISILKHVKHSNIVNLYDVFETRDRLYLQMELVEGGELFERIVSEGFYSEQRAQELLVCMLDALQYLHAERIVHRDLKPENLLMATAGGQSEVKIADFGLAKLMQGPQQFLSTSCGTLTYAAPEVLRGRPYDQSVDMWSLGVIAYILMSGYPPFAGDSDAALLEATLAGSYEFFSPEWDDISPMAKDFIVRLLVVDPTKRLSAVQALAHPWLAPVHAARQQRLGRSPSAAAAAPQASTAFAERVQKNIARNFNAKRKFRATAEAVVALNKLGSFSTTRSRSSPTE